MNMPVNEGPASAWGDLQRSRLVYRELALRRFALAMQPVVDGRDPARVLYHECLLRHEGPALGFNPIAVLERRQAMGLLDRSVLACVIATLEQHPQLHLGCNLSAQSACADPAWECLWARLRRRPDVAARLVLEITESAAPGDPAQTLAFIASMQALGCRVAIDDFGAGFASLAFVRQAQPDVLKVDRGYLHRARQSDTDAQVFDHLVGLCNALATCVVVEGVEDGADQQRVLRAGATWQQGFHFGRPSLRAPVADCRVVLLR
ncbi:MULTISPECIES: EAL domain-containing protein [Pseudomonas]|uniref:EAL domain-containing protein n=1 Tax=Pseudomonas TaxID=286 RepID=UPI001E57F9EA|nr:MULTISPECIES: EAL domain-containing protein [Pseudomonas]MCE1113675.1 EAL domain-containing protein [Pseudomonas sp. NMI795_08]